MEIIYGFLIAIGIIYAYALGMKTGQNLTKGIVPRVNSNPIQTILASVKKPKIEPEESIDELLLYSVNDALKAIKEDTK